MLKDFREFLADNLQDPESRREFVIAFYEEDGIEGIRAALEEIAYADAVHKIKPTITVPSRKEAEDLDSLRAILNTMGLGFGLVRISLSGEAM